ncbi:MAG: formate dehydrogenase accessory protein FdhE [Bacillota bacterium]|nr:formate dehydrogenase accessory protein FdhE [Bacillota bacterium]
MAEPGLEFVPEGMVSFYNDLLSLEAPETSVQIRNMGKEQREMWENGIPLLVANMPRVEPEDFFATMRRVKDILAKHQPDQAAELEKTMAAMPTDPGEREVFVESVLRRRTNWSEYLVQQRGVAEDVLGFLLNHTVKPYLSRFGTLVREQVDFDTWGRGYCPVCGAQANFARLSKAVGRRYLHCPLCETEWWFKRIGCPFCDNEDQKELRYFTVEGDERHRVYLCEKCKGYLKTIDESRCGENEKAYLFWEDVKTVHLDLLAMREGYVNKVAEGANQ